MSNYYKRPFHAMPMDSKKGLFKYFNSYFSFLVNLHEKLAFMIIFHRFYFEILWLELFVIVLQFVSLSLVALLLRLVIIIWTDLIMIK